MTEHDQSMIPALPYELERRSLRDRAAESAPKMYDAAVDLNVLAHRHRDRMAEICNAENNPDISLQSLVFARGVESLQAAILLCEVGASIEANILVRSGLESLFALAASTRGFPLKDNLDKAHASARKSWAKAQRSVDEKNRFDQQTLDFILSETESIQRYNLNYSELAEAGGLRDLYTCLYKPLSHFSVHVSAGSLGEIMEADAESQIAATLNLIVQVYGRLIAEGLGVVGNTAMSEEYVRILTRVSDTEGSLET